MARERKVQREPVAARVPVAAMLRQPGLPGILVPQVVQLPAQQLQAAVVPALEIVQAPVMLVVVAPVMFRLASLRMVRRVRLQ